MTSFMVLMETLVGSVSIAVGGCGAAGSIAVLAPARAAREYAARRMRLGPVLLDAERLSFARAQRTAMQRSTLLCSVTSTAHRWASQSRVTAGAKLTLAPVLR